MRNIFFTILFLFSSAIFSQQSDKELILSDSENFLANLLKKDFEAILDMTYPVVFEEFSREKLKQLLIAAFEGDEKYSFEFLDVENRKYEISDIYKTGTESKYVFITYPFSMKFQINDPKLTKQLRDEMLMRLSKEGVQIEVIDDNNYIISKLGMILGFNDEKTSGKWKYLNHNSNNQFLLKFVPEQILRNANNYYSEKLKSK